MPVLQKIRKLYRRRTNHQPKKGYRRHKRRGKMNQRLNLFKKYNQEGGRGKLNLQFSKSQNQLKDRGEMMNLGLHKFPEVVEEDLEPEIFPKMMTPQLSQKFLKTILLLLLTFLRKNSPANVLLKQKSCVLHQKEVELHPNRSTTKTKSSSSNPTLTPCQRSQINKFLTKTFLKIINQTKMMRSKHLRKKTKNRLSSKREEMRTKRMRMMMRRWNKKTKIMTKRQKMRRMGRMKKRSKMIKKRMNKRKRMRLRLVKNQVHTLRM